MAIIIKLVFLYYYLFIQTSSNTADINTWARLTNDSFSYITPFENLYTQGNYDPDFRMPGYGWLYFLLRFLFSKVLVLNLIPFIQLITASVSVYILALIGQKIFKASIAFPIVFFLYAIQFNVSYYDAFILTESFSLSALIFSFYFLISFNEKAYRLVLSGLFLTWAIFMKPVLLPLLGLFFLASILLTVKQLNLKFISLKNGLLFLSAFICIEGIWIIRNYMHHREFFVLTKTMYVPAINNTYQKSVFSFARAAGFSQTGWEPESEFNYFLPLKAGSDISKIKFNDDYFTSKFNSDSLKVVRNWIELYLKPDLSTHQKLILDSLISAKLDAYTLSIKEEKPFHFYIGSRIKILKLFFGHTGVYNLFHRPTNLLSPFEKMVKAIFSLIYLSTVFFGLAGLFTTLIKNKVKINAILFFVLTGLYLVFIHPLVMKMDEYRYILPAFPFLVLAAARLLLFLGEFFILNKKPIHE
jgi:hypothetical protein